MSKIRDNDLRRFWAKVDKDGPIPNHAPELGRCWEWTACLRDGYGHFRYCETMWSAHRFGYWIQTGIDPRNTDGQWVLHKCDNRKCVRGDHLYLGDEGDNCRDTAERYHGFKRDKMDHDRADEIRVLYATGDYSQSDLAAKFGLTTSMVGKIILNKNWVRPESDD